MESNEFHWKDGWRFRLQECGCIRIQKLTGQKESAQALIPAAEWDSVVSFIAQVRQADMPTVSALTQRIRDQQNAPDDGSEPYVVHCPSLQGTKAL
jgi:hypothetical protein